MASIEQINRQIEAAARALEAATTVLETTFDPSSLPRLLGSAKWEIENLCKKLADKEQEGWEGARRRYVLKQDLQKAIQALS